jgi:small subunit ribosomal protein S21
MPRVRPRIAVDTTSGDMNQGNESDNSAMKPRNPEATAGDRGGDAGRGRPGALGADQADRARAGAMEVVVSHNIEKAMKILKRKLIKEGLFKELKARRYFEKPSVRRKRKEKEARKKQRKDEARLRKGPGLM